MSITGVISLSAKQELSQVSVPPVEIETVKDMHTKFTAIVKCKLTRNIAPTLLNTIGIR